MILTDATDAAAVYLDDLAANPDNPRQNLGDIAELAESIRELGVLQPLLVVDSIGHDGIIGINGSTGRYMVVDGHRRLAALRSIDFDDTIPVRVVSMNRTERLLAALATQGKPLDPLDEARAYQALIDLDLTQRQIAERVGCNQSHVSRRLALLELDDDTKAAVADGKTKLRDAEAKARGKEPAKPKPAAVGVDYAQATGWRDKADRLEVENAALREIAAKAREAVVEVKAALAEQPAAVEVEEPHACDPFFWTTHHNKNAPKLAWADNSDPVGQFVRHLVSEVVRLAGCLLPRCFWHDGEPCTHGYVPTAFGPPEHLIAAAQLDQPGQRHLIDVPEIDDDTCLGCNGTGLWNGQPCSDCQPEPDGAEPAAKCVPFAPGTVGATSHCKCWFQESLNDEPGPCCWCGSDDDDSDQCHPKTEQPAAEPASVDIPPDWVTKQPWGTYNMSATPRLLGVIGKCAKVDTLHRVIAYERAHDARAEILDAARARLVDLGASASADSAA